MWATLVVAAWSDLKAAARHLRATPRFTIGAIGVLAAAVAANATLYAALNSLLLEPPPHSARGGVRVMGSAGNSGPGVFLSGADLVAVRSLSVFDAVFGYRLSQHMVECDGFTDRLFVEAVTHNALGEVGVKPVVGRLLTLDDERHSAPVVVVSKRLYDIISQNVGCGLEGTLTIRGARFTIVGVLPAEFFSLSVPKMLVADAWLPARLLSETGDSDGRSGSGEPRLMVQGVVNRAASLDVVERELSGLARTLDAAEGLPEGSRTFRVLAIPEDDIHPSVKSLAIPFAGAVMFLGGSVLVLACLNIGSLQIARTADRLGEVAVRLALGSTVGGVVRVFALEGALLAVAGGLGGLAVGHITAFLMNGAGGGTTIAPGFALRVAMNGRVGLVCIIVLAIASIVCGFVPISRVLRRSIRDLLWRNGAIRSLVTKRVGTAVLVPQVAVSYALLLVAVVSLAGDNLFGAWGSSYDTRATASISLETRPGTVAPHAEALVARLTAEADIDAVALSDATPLETAGHGYVVGENRRVPMRYSRVSPGWFATMNGRVRSGRDFVWSDHIGIPPVAIVNETAARDICPLEGMCSIAFEVAGARDAGRSPVVLQVVGVVPDLPESTGRRLRIVYLPIADQPSGRLVILVRGARVAQALAAAKQVAGSNVPGAILMDARPLATQRAEQDVFRSVTGRLFLCLSLVAVALVMFGLYTVTVTSVERRRRELALRSALGAPPLAVIRLVLSSTIVATVVGSCIGAALALSLGASLRLFAGPRWAVLGSAGLLATLCFVAFCAAAAYLPARRALRGGIATILRGDGR